MDRPTHHAPDGYRPFVEELCQRFQVPGLVVGLASEGRTESLETFGQRDRERDLPATPDTLFGIGSVTKSFSAIAIMQLVERGRLDLDTPIVHYLPGFRTRDPEHTRHITLHHLLTHSSGMPPMDLLYRAMGARDYVPIRTTDEFLAALAEEDMRYVGAPGELFSYSNEGFALLAPIIEAGADRPYTEWMADHILGPCGLGRTTFRTPGAADDPVATVYAETAPGADRPEPADGWRDAPTMLACGFLRSTVPDLLRYLEIFRNRGRVDGVEILTAASVERMMMPHMPYSLGQAYGYGLRITEAASGLRLVEHSGGLQGVSAHVVVVPERGLAAASLANLMSAPTGRAALSLVHARLGLPLDMPRVTYEPDPNPLDQERLGALVGVYVNGEGDQLAVTLRAGAVWVDNGDQLTAFQHIARLGFAGRYPGAAEPSFVQFLPDARGEVTRMTSGSRVFFRAADIS